MKLIVFRNLCTKYKYRDRLIGDMPFSASTHKVGRTVLMTYLPVNLIDLRGYTFDEVLWVGFQDELEVAAKCPSGLLAQIHLSNPKYHFCNPPLA